MRAFVMALAVVLAGADSMAAEFPQGKLVDLTHPYDETTIFWPTETGFVLEKGPAGITEMGYFYAANRFCTPEHGGTHVDAPVHFAAKGLTVDQIPLDQLMGAAVVVDASRQSNADRDYRLVVADLRGWEESHGRIPDRAIVLFRTGFGRFWPDRKKYLGTADRGEAAVAKLHFPGLHVEAARWLMKERYVKAVGIDTASIDHGQSTRFETHVALFENNVPAFENLANLDLLPPKDMHVIALPMKIRGGSGGPLRIVAIISDRSHHRGAVR